MKSTTNSRDDNYKKNLFIRLDVNWVNYKQTRNPAVKVIRQERAGYIENEMLGSIGKFQVNVKSFGASGS